MDYKRELETVLLQLGVNKSYAGFAYVVYGTDLVMKDRACIKYITKSLYIDIALHFHTTKECVERNIRTLIHAVWKAENKELLKLICSDAVTKKPTNKEFFLMLTDYIASREDKEKIIELCGGIEHEFQMSFICPKDGTICYKYKSLEKS